MYKIYRKYVCIFFGDYVNLFGQLMHVNRKLKFCLSFNVLSAKKIDIIARCIQVLSFLETSLFCLPENHGIRILGSKWIYPKSQKEIRNCKNSPRSHVLGSNCAAHGPIEYLPKLGLIQIKFPQELIEGKIFKRDISTM